MNIGHHRRKWKSPILHELFFVTYFRLLFFLRTWNQNFFFCFHVGKFSCPFSFAQEYLLFFRLQAKQNFHYNDRTRSGLFLRAVQSSQFADTITLLQSHINSYREEFEDGYLPPNLRLHGLATSLNQNAQSRI